MRPCALLLLASLGTAGAFSAPLPTRTLGASAAHASPRHACARHGLLAAPAIRSPIRLRMADESKEAMTNSVESFEEMVRKVTGKSDYKFGDLSKASVKRITATVESVEKGTTDVMEKANKIVVEPDYEFGDLTKAAAKEVMEWGKKERKAFETITGKPYEFGDISKFLANNVLQGARQRLGPDYQFGDLTKAAAASTVKAIENYKFGDISKGVFNMFQKIGEKAAEGVKIAEEGAAAMAEARLQLLEQEKMIISDVLNKGAMKDASAKDMGRLLAQEMSSLEALCEPDAPKPLELNSKQLMELMASDGEGQDKK